MKKIIGYLKDFYVNHINKYELLSALLFVAVLVYVRYIYILPNDKSYLTDMWHQWYWAGHNFSFHYLLYLLPLVYGYVSSSLWHQDWTLWKTPKFYALVIIAVGVFSIRSVSGAFYEDIITRMAGDYEHYDWLRALVSTAIRSLLLLLPLFLFWIMVDRKNQPFYGFTLRGFDTKPYFILLLMMLPLIVAASTQGDFLGAYPRGAKITSLDIHNTAHWKFFGIYEFIYGLDFISIEFFFRGFLILAFVGIGGPRVILPMAIFYATIHWNKPAGELISSFFGGSILGIVTYYSRSIIGGIIVHMGIAWLMEIGALVGNYLKT